MTRLDDADVLADSNSELIQHRRTCIHEAGHAAVARHYGLTADWVVYPNPTTEPHRQKLWGGITNTYAERWTKKMDRAIGLAGVIATALDENPYISAGEIMDALEWGDIVLSAPDAEMAAGYKAKDVRDCLFVVSRLLPQILRDASRRELDDELVWVPPGGFQTTTIAIRTLEGFLLYLPEDGNPT